MAIIHKKVLGKVQTLGKEFKKYASTAMIAAFSLVIALAWRDVINDLINQIGFVKEYGILSSAIILTLIGVICILIISKWVNSGEKSNEKI